MLLIVTYPLPLTVQGYTSRKRIQVKFIFKTPVFLDKASADRNNNDLEIFGDSICKMTNTTSIM